MTSCVTDRLKCRVPNCRRTTVAGDYTNWLCIPHRKLVAPATRPAWARLRRLACSSPEPAISQARFNRLWRRLERAAGVTPNPRRI